MVCYNEPQIEKVWSNLISDPAIICHIREGKIKENEIISH